MFNRKFSASKSPTFHILTVAKNCAHSISEKGICDLKLVKKKRNSKIVEHFIAREILKESEQVYGILKR